MEAAEREAEGQAAQAAEAARRADRLAGESGELQAALEQKQELIAALQVGRGGPEVVLRWGLQYARKIVRCNVVAHPSFANPAAALVTGGE